MIDAPSEQRQPSLRLPPGISFLEDDSCVRTTGRIKVYLTLPLPPHFLPAWQGKGSYGEALRRKDVYFWCSFFGTCMQPTSDSQ